jgi:hypothetical protein
MRFFRHADDTGGLRPRERLDPRADIESRFGLPRPTAGYRRRAWAEFQRALDPLAPLKPLRPPRV